MKDDLYRLPAQTRTSVLAYISLQLKDLLLIQEFLPASLQNIPEDLEAFDDFSLFPEILSVSGEVLRIALQLATLGWRKHVSVSKDMFTIFCGCCYRTVGLWNVKNGFDPVNQHRHYCVFTAKIDEIAGWTKIFQLLKSN